LELQAWLKLTPFAVADYRRFVLQLAELAQQTDRGIVLAEALRDSGKNIDERLLPPLSPLGWEHINLTGDYIWRQNKQVEQGKFRPLRVPGEA
jgi:hypothetical protein